MRKTLVILLGLVTQLSFAEFSRVPITNIELPANDLVHPDYGLIDPEFALELANDGLDLSTLNPLETEEWMDKDFSQSGAIKDQSLPLEEGEVLSYNGVIKSPSGKMRFNAIKDGLRFQVHLAKNLHTILLRKNLLRKLGFDIPAMKYMKQITITFDSVEQKNFFKDIEVLSDTAAASARWIVKESEMSLTLQDVYVKMPTETEGFDLAFTMFPDKLTSRPLRAALVPYSLLDLGESVNKFSYSALKVENKNLIFSHDTESIFNASIDDVKWMARKISQLTKEDLKEIVDQAYFPDVVSQIVYNKILARRNDILKTLNIDSQELSYKKDLKLEGVKDGYLITQQFPGYASRFSHGVQKGPLDDLWSYAKAEIQSNVISSAVDMANEYLTAFKPEEARLEWMQEDFLEHKDWAIEYFQEHGEFPELPFGTWRSPMFKGNFILSRDIVIGGALGTDNFVQLADSAGFQFSMGLYIGLERVFSKLVNGVAMPNLSSRVIYTHARPIISIKEALKQPYKNILVNFLTKRLNNHINELQNGKELTQEERKIFVSEVFSEISKELGVGDSLIISNVVSPDASVTLKMPVFNGGVGSLGVGAREKILQRVQIYRKSQYEFQVYDDNGNVREVYSRGGLSYLIPLLNGEMKRSEGKMNIKFTTLNLDPDLKSNPDFYKNVQKLVSIIKDKSVASEGDGTVNIESLTNDKSTKFNILMFVNKSLRKLSQLLVKLEGTPDTKFISSTYGTQRGMNYKNFLKDLANHYLAKEFDYFSFSVNPFENAGRTLLGTAHTEDTRFEAKVRDTELDNNFSNIYGKYAVTIKREEGGAIREKKLWRKLKKLNEFFKRDIYQKQHSQDAGKLSLYKIESRIHLYDKAIDKIVSLSKNDLSELERQMRKRVANNVMCRQYFERNAAAPILKQLKCADFKTIQSRRRICHKKFDKREYTEGYSCLAQYISYLTRFVDFDILSELVGEDNIYLESEINGFRDRHEYLYRPIRGKSFGRENGKFVKGPFQAIQNFLGIMKGEFEGSWYRERL